MTMTHDQWNALPEADKERFRERLRAQNNRDYSPQMDIWYARDVYHVGRGFLAFWLVLGILGLGVFGLLVLALMLGV